MKTQQIILSNEQLDQLADRIAKRLTNGKTGGVAPRWLKLKSAEQYCGLNVRTLQRRISGGLISSKLAKTEGSNRGVRLIDRLSLDAYIEGCPDESLWLAMNNK